MNIQEALNALNVVFLLLSLNIWCWEIKRWEDKGGIGEDIISDILSYKYDIYEIFQHIF